MQEPLLQILLALGLAVVVVLAFQRLRLPPVLGYLLVGVLLGPNTVGPIIDARQIELLAELGIVFLLFTIGLNYSLPQLNALRGVLLTLGTGQVVLTTVVVAGCAWLLGLSPAAAFVVGAVFAQSSTTIIARQLSEQKEDQSRHGRVGTALSVFQDVTAVPFIVIIPVLGVAAGGEIAGALALALAKGILAFVLVFLVGRWLLRPLFIIVAARRSAELFTMTVLLVSLGAAWTTKSLGLSMAFGAFLAGMMLGETEFRHQVEGTIRPFRDVLLGLFFVSIGLLFDPRGLPEVWLQAVAAGVGLLLVKTLLVAGLARVAGIDWLTAWQTGLIVAVGGEFGFALLSLGLNAGVISHSLSQVTLVAVMFSMIAGAFLIRFNSAIAMRLTPDPGRPSGLAKRHDDLRVPPTTALGNHVIICGYGRIGQSLGHSLEEENIPFIAVDLDAVRVAEARLAGEPVFYGDATNRDVLESLGIERARLLVISHGDIPASEQILHHIRASREDLPVMVRTRDEIPLEKLRAAGATEVVPETHEASLMIASHALLLLDVPLSHVARRIQRQWSGRYRLLRELIPGQDVLGTGPQGSVTERLRPVRLPEGCYAVGKTIAELPLAEVIVTALARQGRREVNPAPNTVLAPDDVIVLFGVPDDLLRVQRMLLG
jgi:monovalent cation:H+ antiporter-2, CPA2 family